MRIRAVLLLSTLPLLTAGCSGGGKGDGPPGDKAKAGAQPAVPVVVSTVARKTVPVQVEAVGKVEPLSTVAVLARVGGELTGVHFTEGQEVQKGQVLFTLDPRPYQAALDQAQAAVARDKAVAANSASDLKRYGDLVQKEYVTREQYDRIAAETTSAGATVKADEAAVEAARLQLEYCTIRSPLSGRTGSLLVHQGNLVKANDAQPLVVINQIRPIYVSFSVPQAQLPAIERYRSAGRLTVEALPAEGGGAPQQGPQQGTLSFIDNQIDRSTGTILLKATFPNESRTLWPGQFTKVRLTLARQADAVVVPAQAVQTGQQGQYVYVVRPDQTVEPRTVQVSRTVGGDTVIAAGLTPGETVVTDGQLRLAPGVKVKTREGRSGAEA
jgi:membrane fusion protein, multidrug efflux system